MKTNFLNFLSKRVLLGQICFSVVIFCFLFLLTYQAKAWNWEDEKYNEIRPHDRLEVNLDSPSRDKKKERTVLLVDVNAVFRDGNGDPIISPNTNASASSSWGNHIINDSFDKSKNRTIIKKSGKSYLPTSFQSYGPVLTGQGGKLLYYVWSGEDSKYVFRSGFVL